ncbi:hypothetical protein [Roseobacter sp. HKCCA0434]|uniref:hypothetical protein n=1 Tax=Roseobacter sp. HKCCA0434 TaxID=3079297 RepID=UPI0029058C78|nr:hypothetical protein [Roseobacter sp. HKCCA0434]
MIRALALACLLAAPACAQDGRDIPLAEWRAMTEGRTVIYRIGPEVFARETYHPGGQVVSILYADGTCLEGTWRFIEPASAYCFSWPNGKFCYRHMEDAQGLYVLPVDESGARDARWEIQRIEGISERTVSCEIPVS